MFVSLGFSVLLGFCLCLGNLCVGHPFWISNYACACCESSDLGTNYECLRPGSEAYQANASLRLSLICISLSRFGLSFSFFFYLWQHIFYLMAAASTHLPIDYSHAHSRPLNLYVRVECWLMTGSLLSELNVDSFMSRDKTLKSSANCQQQAPGIVLREQEERLLGWLWLACFPGGRRKRDRELSRYQLLVIARQMHFANY